MVRGPVSVCRSSGTRSTNLDVAGSSVELVMQVEVEEQPLPAGPPGQGIMSSVVPDVQQGVRQQLLHSEGGQPDGQLSSQAAAPSQLNGHLQGDPGMGLGLHPPGHAATQYQQQMGPDQQLASQHGQLHQLQQLQQQQHHHQHHPATAHAMDRLHLPRLPTAAVAAPQHPQGEAHAQQGPGSAHAGV